MEFSLLPTLTTTGYVIFTLFQMKKISEGGGQPSPHFDHDWFYQLCELMMTPQAPFVKRQVQSVSQFPTGILCTLHFSKEYWNESKCVWNIYVFQHLFKFSQICNFKVFFLSVYPLLVVTLLLVVTPLLVVTHLLLVTPLLVGDSGYILLVVIPLLVVRPLTKNCASFLIFIPIQHFVIRFVSCCC